MPTVLVGPTVVQNSLFLPSGGRDHRQYSLRLPTEGWPGWDSIGGWMVTYRGRGMPGRRRWPIAVLTGLNVE